MATNPMIPLCQKLLLVILFLLIRCEAALDADNGQLSCGMGRGKENQPNAVPERRSARAKRPKVDSEFQFAPIGLSERHSKAAQGPCRPQAWPLGEPAACSRAAISAKSILKLETETYRCKRGRIQPCAGSEAAAAPLPWPPTA